MARLAWSIGLLCLCAAGCGDDSSGDNPFAEPTTSAPPGPAGGDDSQGDPGAQPAPADGQDGKGGGSASGGGDDFEIGPSGSHDAGASKGDGEVKVPTYAEPKVQCGAKECTGILEGIACCDEWTDKGWASSTCKAKASCTKTEIPPFSTPTRWDVVSECDGREDCGLDQVCCFMLVGPPGTPFARQCLSFASCNDSSRDFTLGRPQGLYSCNDDGLGELGKPGSDCPIDGQTCVPEPDGADSAAGQAGRPHVGVCQ